MLSRAVIAATPATLLALAACLFFLNKAYTIDDATFLLAAEHMLVDPLHPFAFDLVFHGIPTRASTNVTGPVMAVLLIPAVLAQGAEWLAHSVMLLVFVVGLVSSAALSLRLGTSDEGAAWVSLLVATSAAVLAMATTSMPDVPAMAFGALGAERLLAFRSHRRAWTGIAAAVALALAVLSRLHLILAFIPLAGLLLPTWPHNLRAARDMLLSRPFLVDVLPLAFALVLLWAVTSLTRDPQTGMHFVGAVQHNLQWPLLRVNVSQVPAQWVLAFPLGLAWSALRGRQMLRSRSCWLGALIGVVLALLVPTANGQWHRTLWQAPTTALGMAILVDIAVDGWRRRDTVQICLLAWLLIAWPAAIYYHLPAKYLVPSAPAMALLVARQAEHGLPRTLARYMVAGVALVGLALGMAIAHADAALAEAGRIGGQTAAEYVKRGERVWYDGGWSFAWYARRAGARPMSIAPSLPEPGDVVVVGLASHLVAERCSNDQLLQDVVIERPGGRIQDGAAGFYTNAVGYGTLPWIWRSKVPTATGDPGALLASPLGSHVTVWRIGSCR